MPYRLVAIDLDGTLMNSAHGVSERNMAALRMAMEAGMVVAPATARPYVSARRIFDERGLEVPIIASGGASVRAHDGTVIREAALPDGVARAVAEVCQARGWGATLATGDRMFYLARERPAWFGRTMRTVEFVEDASGVPEQGVLSVIINGPAEAERELGLERWDGTVRAHRARTNDLATLTTITAANADKGHGLGALCGYAGVEVSEAVAIGDSEVDLPMFNVAGLAVAMGNAAESIKVLAHRVTASADEDGVALVIEALMAEGEAAGK